jgi:hypothetical protein
MVYGEESIKSTNNFKGFSYKLHLGRKLQIWHIQIAMCLYLLLTGMSAFLTLWQRSLSHSASISMPTLSSSISKVYNPPVVTLEEATKLSFLKAFEQLQGVSPIHALDRLLYHASQVHTFCST